MIQPVNPNATKEAAELLIYMDSIKGNGVLVGQHTLTMEQEELHHIEKVTGKLPALCGFELLSYSPNINYETCDEAALKEIYENRGTLEKAYEWAAKGGILTFTWHWYSPIGGKDKAFYTKNTDFDASKVLIPGTKEREAFYHDMDAMAELLQGFAVKKIPILWRPFHEAEGDWFWWGAKGMDVARQLYRLMFVYYTKEKHLDNLIWVWNNRRADGYVGDDYCDVVTGDWYEPPHQYTTMKVGFEELQGITPNKLYAMGELGLFPGIDRMKEEGAEWLWFMMWSGEFVLTEKCTTEAVLKEQYNHPYAITLDKLPKFSWLK